MKYIFILIGLLAVSSAWAYESYSSDHPVHVQSYDRKDGAHVNDYYRAEPGQKSNDVFGNGRARDNF